ncbi:hypothetical protein ACFPPA_13310 [Rhodanobacter ginsengisoli]|uniref:Succinate dehydrogenase n=1 Tax=Rhodanobacter ginsengisoli TaxID=418646 RepID=A0ABW0QPN7_9GAMM
MEFENYMVHRMIGVVVLMAWLWMVLHMQSLAPGLDVAASSNITLYAGRGGGVFYVSLIPLLAAALLIFPDFFAGHFSPSSEMTNEPLLGAGFWRLSGYFALLVSWGLLHLFR